MSGMDLNSFGWLTGDDGSRNPVDDVTAENKAMLEEAARAMREKARLFYDVLGTGRGPELLALLREETIEINLMSVSRTIGDALREVSVTASEWAYHRNGQNSVVHYLEFMVREAKRSETEGANNV